MNDSEKITKQFIALWNELPEGWTIHKSRKLKDDNGYPMRYFYNREQKITQWEHPLNEERLIELENKYLSSVQIKN